MRSRLIRTSGEFPPGSFAFRDKITGKNYDDQHTTFDERVKQIINDRRANRRLFTDPRLVDVGYVSIELSEQICERIGNNPRFCDFDSPPQTVTTLQGQTVTVVPGKHCSKCGSTNLEELLCQTCGGRKVVGWKCRSCNHEMTR